MLHLAGMKLSIVSQKLWKSLQPLQPSPTRSRRSGRPRLDDRAALNDILFVLTTWIPWEDLLQELSFGSGMTCWWRLRDWQAQGTWDRLHLASLTPLRQCDQIDWSRASIDEASLISTGVRKPPLPTDRRSVPLALSITNANRYDSMAFEALVDTIPTDPGLPSRPRRQPHKLHTDKGYDFRRCCEQRCRKQRETGTTSQGRGNVLMCSWPASASFASASSGTCIPITPCASWLVP